MESVVTSRLPDARVIGSAADWEITLSSVPGGLGRLYDFLKR